MKYKKYILILIISIIIFFVLTYVYNNILNKDEYVEVFVLNETVIEGEKIDEGKISKIKILTDINKFDFIRSDKELKNMVANNTIYKGSIILKSNLIDEVEYKNNKNLEYVSIKVSSSDSSASYQVLPGSLINIYYSGKTDQINDLISSFNKTFSYISSGMQESYMTVNLLENMYVIDTFNKSGISLNDKDNLSGDVLIDTIMIKVDKDTALLINNLKKYGEFSFSIIKWGIKDEYINY